MLGVDLAEALEPAIGEGDLLGASYRRTGRKSVRIAVVADLQRPFRVLLPVGVKELFCELAER
jgi:hypothetical protein